MNTPERKRSRPDYGFIIVFLIAVIAIWPFVSRFSLPVETDAELHIFRLFELGQLVRGGEIYPRWAPDFYHGFGYPIFNYYAPLSYYLGLPVELLPPFDAVDGVKFVFVLGLLAGAFGLYGYMRDNWGRESGYIAAAVYLYAPYIQYIDPHARGVLAESFSLGIFPVALWVLDRVRRGARGGTILLAVTLVAGVVLSHNLMALLFFGMLIAWAVWHSLLARKIEWPLFMVLSLGVGLAAFFWLPVYGEREAVNLNTLLGKGDNYDFHTHFLTLGELFSFSHRLDWGASQPDFRFNIGTAQWLLGGGGIVALIWGRAGRGQSYFFVLATFVLSTLMLPVSTLIWENFPLLPFFQFPWRLLGPVAITLAVLAGAGMMVILSAWGEKAIYGVIAAVLLPILFGFPLSQPAPWGQFGDVNMLRLTLIENSGRWLGTTSTSDYVPSTVDTLPKRVGSVVAQVAAGGPFDRVNWAVVPEGATVEVEHVRPLFTRYEISTPKNFRLRLYQFDFPGWQVRVDGEQIEKEIGRPEGFLVIPLTAGEHIVEVEFGPTPVRRAGAIISWGCLLLAAVFSFTLPRQKPALDSKGVEGFQKAQVSTMPLLTALVGIILLFALVLEPSGRLRLESTGYTALPAQEPLFADFGEQIALIGFTAPTRGATPGQEIPITIYWKAQVDLDINYQVFLHLRAADGRVIAQSDKINPGDFPTRRWNTEKYVRDLHLLTLPGDIFPGSYTVSTGLWVQDEGWRLPLLDENLAQVGDHQQLFTLEIEN